MPEELRNVKQLILLLSEELGVRPSLIPEAVRALRGRITWVDSPYPTGGRTQRLYGPEAVAAIRVWIEDWKKQRAGGTRAVAPAARFWLVVAQLDEAGQRLHRRLNALQELRQEIDRLCHELREVPMPIATSIQVLSRGLKAARPVGVLVRPLPRGWLAASVDLPQLNALGDSPEGAVDALRSVLVSSYLRLSEEPQQDGELWEALTELIRRREG